MLKKIVDKRNYIILFVIIILIIWVMWSLFFGKNKPYIESFNYYGETITFMVYDDVDHKKLTDEINNIYKKYEDMDYDGELSEDEKSLIEYGKILYYKTDGYIDVTDGELISNLKDGKEYDFKSDIEKLDSDNLSDDISLNFDSIIGSYATNEVLYYFKQNDIKKYVVNENGDIAAGDYYDDGKYAISINKPNSDEVMDIVYLENKAMATRSKSDEFESYMVSPKSSKKENKYDSVIVIANDSLTANMLVNSLYIMDKDEGEKLVLDYNGEAMWVNGDDVDMTDGFVSYLKK